MDDNTYRCPHCGDGFSKFSIRKHTVVCPHNPEVAERVRAFLREHAIDGDYIMTSENYNRRSRGTDLPSETILRRYLGSWADIAAWAGLLVFSAERRAAMDAPVPPTPRQDRYPTGLTAKPGTLVVAAWEIRSKSYRPVRAETGWCRLY